MQDLGCRSSCYLSELRSLPASMQRLQLRVFAGLLQAGISSGSACQAARTLASLLDPLQATSGLEKAGAVGGKEQEHNTGRQAE